MNSASLQITIEQNYNEYCFDTIMIPTDTETTSTHDPTDSTEHKHRHTVKAQHTMCINNVYNERGREP